MQRNTRKNGRAKIIIFCKKIKNILKYYLNKKRIFILRLRGANIGYNVTIGSGVQIENAFNFLVEDNVYIGKNFYANCIGNVEIRKGAIISDNCAIMSFNHDYSDKYIFPYGLKDRYKPVIICERSWIGYNVNISPGTVVGKYSIIGMGSTAFGHIPDGVIFAGGKIIKERKSGDLVHAKWDLLEVRNIVDPINYIYFKWVLSKSFENVSNVSFEEIQAVYKKKDWLKNLYMFSMEKMLVVDYKAGNISLRN